MAKYRSGVPMASPVTIFAVDGSVRIEPAMKATDIPGKRQGVPRVGHRYGAISRKRRRNRRNR